MGTDELTVVELMERWLEHLEAKGRSANTLYGYRRYIEREIIPVLGSIRLSKLTVLDVDRLYDSLTRRGLVGRNVAKLVSPPSMPQQVQHPPTPEEVRALLVAASELDPTLGAHVRLVAATGVRQAEACAVRWGDLGFEAKTGMGHQLEAASLRALLVRNPKSAYRGHQPIRPVRSGTSATRPTTTPATPSMTPKPMMSNTIPRTIRARRSQLVSLVMAQLLGRSGPTWPSYREGGQRVSRDTDFLDSLPER